MGKKPQSSSRSKGGKSATADNNHPDLPSSSSDGGGGMYVDPSRIRFQHSRIRPFFSGCGRSVERTLEEIRNGTIPLSDLPPIQVLVGNGNVANDDADESWYFSLNNRRLWVLKRLREEGLLEHCHNKVWVRVRTPKSQQERDRYTVANCALEAKIVPEKIILSKTSKKIKKEKTKSAEVIVNKADEDEDSYTEKEDTETLNGRRSQDLVNGLNGLLNHSSDYSEENEDDDDGPPSNRFGALLVD